MGLWASEFFHGEAMSHFYYLIYAYFILVFVFSLIFLIVWAAKRISLVELYRVLYAVCVTGKCFASTLKQDGN